MNNTTENELINELNRDPINAEKIAWIGIRTRVYQKIRIRTNCQASALIVMLRLRIAVQTPI